MGRCVCSYISRHRMITSPSLSLSPFDGAGVRGEVSINSVIVIHEFCALRSVTKVEKTQKFKGLVAK